MEFRTKINIEKPAFTITHKDKLLLSGSCFTENIGQYLNNYQFKTVINPFGIIYNPVSIFNSLEKVTDKVFYTENDLIQHNELFISLDHHGIFSEKDKMKVLENINAEIEKAHDVFNVTGFIIVTLGTSFVYHHKLQNKIVANCHKIPNTQFEKRLLSTSEIIETFDSIKSKLKDKTILFTVSPVRHWRDGAVENQRSKSILIESIHQIMLQNKNCFYFPAYEIMMDELRDYRFYNEDMLHPNAVAIKYIWQRFSETYFDNATKEINNKIEKINLLLQHKVKNENTAEDESFQKQKQVKIESFKKDHPEIEINFKLQ